MVLVFVALAVGLGCLDDMPDYEKLKSQWIENNKGQSRDDAVKPAQAKVDAIESEIAAKQEKLKELKGGIRNTTKEQKSITADIEKLKKDLGEANYKLKIAETKRLQAPGIDPRSLDKGTFGKLGTDGNRNEPPQFVVVSIVSKDSAILRWGEQGYFWADMNTDGLVTDQKLSIKDFVHCLGTKTYTAVNGASRTCRWIRVVK